MKTKSKPAKKKIQRKIKFSRKSAAQKKNRKVSVQKKKQSGGESNMQQQYKKLKEENDRLIATEKRYRILYDKTPTLLRTVTIDGILTDCNEAYLKSLGYSMDEIIGKQINDHTATRSIKEMDANVEHWKKTHETLPSEVWMKRKDGSIFPTLLSGTSLYDEHGKLTARTLAIVDMTEIYETRENLEHKEARLRERFDDLKKTHERLETAEKTYRTLYEKSPSLLRTITIDGILTDCNEAYMKSLGYTKEKIIGMSIYDHTAERSLNDLKDDYEKWRETHEVSHREIWMKRKDGSIFPTVLSGASLYDENNNIIGRTVALTDISELRETMDHVQELEKVDQLKEEFLSMVTHELKSPLTPIIGFAQALKRTKMLGDLNAKQLDAVETILASAVRLKKLIGDLLDAQKLDLGKMKFDHADIKVDELLKRIESAFTYTAKEKNITFVNSNTENTIINSDRDRIEQVMTNLIYNAIDFVPKEGGRIEINAKSRWQ
ncbi:hypothetical protein DYY67_1356 [Candidatus Nitrosotalea sp. TS]|uniref:PAS domain-containing sensor histidine kinase n=1 Tax=Candidatus Nitrosotalea sp. TS TaxID=2341020 RepID=UPI00140DDA89|nr:PAS domain-containing sensor histidine kinase [Candidatus Nitrosotalea sp. TS]NHI03561.1 hypothetical protein [Candidatus Nitrosotalea sp. TS]